MKFISIILLMFAANSCNQQNKDMEQNDAAMNTEPVEVAVNQEGMEKAYFASGCFWCVEEIFESVKGVSEAVSGYSGGSSTNPTYQNHADHAEANEVIYNPDVVSFKTLVDVYFASQDVEQVNGQGPDRGESYRSIIFYQNAEQKQIIDAKIEELEADGYDVAAEVKPFQKFYVAEDYHQDYAENNPNNGYIQNVSIPRWRRFAAAVPKGIIKDGVSH
ncbi:peptide-methionine (S)-S-oxide reductase [Nonlabens sp. Hel1_33_55]|uniref:peptide-methionine (S)-S-oxide reductase MsrA n=1 Tax=Nonlabens sp. Hel1_33_55 TaxID=1336802 RepID=UPI000875B2BE|nr:peptide-methionine (S)-S-oxide reductase MsrA [Nonlabens sp. Hel1_33_55]SCY22777.1 peptide-methionine (S)-S-oxide reductase [Nonlabens sp. Hel1_33_55]